jgi:hypothetical protein
MFRFLRIRFALLAALALFAAPGAPAYADEVTAALTEASKVLDEGVPVKAIEIINRTLTSGKVPSNLAAKALLMRARAQEKLGKYAYALADYNQALWMEGLSANDKNEAQTGRNRILATLGVSDSGKKTAAASAPSPAARTASASASSSGWAAQGGETRVETSPSEERTGGIGSIFAGLFDSSAQSQPEKAVKKVPRPKPAPKVSAQPVTVASSSPAPSTANDSVANNAGAAAPQAEPTGAFAIQFAALRSEDKAIYEVDRVEKRYGEWLGGRTPSITIRPTTEGGTLYKIIAEPYKHGEGIATCELLKTKGVDCMLISR